MSSIDGIVWRSARALARSPCTPRNRRVHSQSVCVAETASSLSVKAQPPVRNEDEVTGRLRIAPRSGIRALFRGPRFGSQPYFFQADVAEFFYPQESDERQSALGAML